MDKTSFICCFTVLIKTQHNFATVLLNIVNLFSCSFEAQKPIQSREVHFTWIIFNFIILAILIVLIILVFILFHVQPTMEAPFVTKIPFLRYQTLPKLSFTKTVFSLKYGHMNSKSDLLADLNIAVT